MLVDGHGSGQARDRSGCGWVAYRGGQEVALLLGQGLALRVALRGVGAGRRRLRRDEARRLSVEDADREDGAGPEEDAGGRHFRPHSRRGTARSRSGSFICRLAESSALHSLL